MRRRSFVSGLIGGVIAGSRIARAEPAFNIIIPDFPGGPSGTAARILQPYLESAFARSVTLDFRPGAGGIVGLTGGAQAAPDGTNLTLLTPAVTLAPWLNRRMDCSPGDFAPVGQVSSMPSVLLVRAENSDTTLAGLLARGAHPSTLAVPASASDWGPPEVAQALMLLRAGLTVRMVGGLSREADRLAALEEDEVDFAFVSLDAALDASIASWTRPLAVSSATRVARLKDVPTLREQGFDIAIGAWRALALPAAAAPDMVERYGSVLKTVMADPALVEELRDAGLLPDWLGPAQTRQVLDGEYRTAGALFAALGLTVRKQVLGQRTG